MGQLVKILRGSVLKTETRGSGLKGEVQSRPPGLVWWKCWGFMFDWLCELPAEASRTLNSRKPWERMQVPGQRWVINYSTIWRLEPWGESCWMSLQCLWARFPVLSQVKSKERTGKVYFGFPNQLVSRRLSQICFRKRKDEICICPKLRSKCKPISRRHTLREKKIRWTA